MADQADAVTVVLAELRVAAEIVARRMGDGRYKTQVLRHIGAAMTMLEKRGEMRDDELATKLCKKCGARFSFDEAYFVRRGLTPPRHCAPCRVVRRQAHARGGASVREVGP